MEENAHYQTQNPYHGMHIGSNTDQHKGLEKKKKKDAEITVTTLHVENAF